MKTSDGQSSGTFQTGPRVPSRASDGLSAVFKTIHTYETICAVKTNETYSVATMCDAAHMYKQLTCTSRSRGLRRATQSTRTMQFACERWSEWLTHEVLIELASTFSMVNNSYHSSPDGPIYTRRDPPMTSWINMLICAASQGPDPGKLILIRQVPVAKDNDPQN